MQQDIDPKHTSKSTTEWLQTKIIKVLHWPRPKPYFDSWALPNSWKPNELKQRCKEEQAKIFSRMMQKTDNGLSILAIFLLNKWYSVICHFVVVHQEVVFT